MTDIAWNWDMTKAPRDGTLCLLVVEYDDTAEHPVEDAALSRTIGHNNFDRNGEDVWECAGWSWEQDCFTDSRGGKARAWALYPPIFAAPQPKEKS